MKRYTPLFEEQSAEELLSEYLEIKSKAFLFPEDMRRIKQLMTLMDRAGIDVDSLNIGDYRKNKKQYISKFKNPKRVTNFSRYRR